MTTLLEQWRIALGALRDNAFRALLTALGIIIGVASLVAVSAVSAGAQAGVADSIRRLGANVVVVDGEIISIGTRQTSTDRVMTAADVAAVAKLPMIRATAPHQDVEGIVVSAGSRKASTWSVGMTPAYAQIHNRGVARGRPITDADVSFGRSVALVGPVVQRRLFPGIDPIGKTLRIGNSEFEVIGVLDRRGNLGGSNLDDRIFIPLPIATRVLLGGSNTRSIDVQVRGAADINPAQDAITTLLRRQHELPASYPNDFSTEDAASILKTGETASSTFRVLTYVLGGISLLVGGIGIMNMMLVSVRERTREIGIRMSVGADPRRVQLQFLIEALALSVLGGAAGIVTGIAATLVISNTVGWQTLLDPVQSVIAFLAAMGVGVFFGFYPARKAARLDPISALRYE
jgi:putative ABC transport system permease protein